MSGSAHGKTKHDFINARVGTSDKIKMLYTPAYLRADGKPVSARLVIPILVNEYGRQDPSSYRLVAWGALADLFAKNLSQGKEMTFFCDGSSYWGNVFYSDNMQVLQKDGQTPVQTRQTSFTIREFLWGSDSNRTLTEETTAGMQSGEGKRPMQWKVAGTPDNLTWKSFLEKRKQTFYLGGERYGYATVVAPRAAGCQIMTGDQSKILRTHAQPVQGVPIVAAVTQALNPAPMAAPVIPVAPVLPAAQPVAGALPVYPA